MQKCLHDGQDGADVEVCGGPLRWEQQKPTRILVTVKIKRQLKATTDTGGRQKKKLNNEPLLQENADLKKLQSDSKVSFTDSGLSSSVMFFCK